MVELAVWFIENALSVADAAETNWTMIIMKKRDNRSVIGTISTINVTTQSAVVSPGKDGERQLA